MAQGDYSDGFNHARIPDPSNWDQYKGTLDRQRLDEARRELEQRHTSRPTSTVDWSTPAQGDGGGLGILILIVAAITAAGWLAVHLFPLVPILSFVAVWLSIATFIGGVLFLLSTRLLGRGIQLSRADDWCRLTYARARQTAWKGIWQFVVVTAGVRMLATWFSSGRLPGGDIEHMWADIWRAVFVALGSLSTRSDWRVFLDTGSWGTVARTLLLTRVPGFVLCVWQLRRAFRPYYTGASGVLKACVVAFITLEVSLSVSALASVKLSAHVSVWPFAGDDRFSIVLLFLAVLVVPGAILGGFVGGALLLLATRVLSSGREGSYWQSYGTSVRALFVYGLMSVLAVYLFRDADGLLRPLASTLLGGSVPPASPTEQWIAGVVAVVAFQIPGFLLASRQLVRRERGVYRGVCGFARALVVASTTCVATCGPLWGAGLIWLPALGNWAEPWLSWRA